MNERAVIAGTAVVIVVIVLACGQPTAPAKVPTPIPPGVISLKITAPASIAPGQTVQFTATGLLSNGTTEDDTSKVNWTASPTSVLTITPNTGEATAQAAGDVTIQATYRTPCCQAQISMTVLPTNTFRLTGKVLESGLPVPGAVITVLSGIGTGLSATTDGSGAYRLYGVAGPIQVRFTKSGYDNIVKTFTASQNDVLDFPDAHQTAGIPSLAGTYRLTLTADPACPTSPVKGMDALPDDFRQPRSYAASLTQNGPSVSVTLTDSEIVSGHNNFTGRVEPGVIEFQIGSYDYYYGLTSLITERLSSTQEFEFGGQLHAQRSGSGIVGRLDGTLEIVTPPGHITAQCSAPNNQVMLTPSAQPSRHR
jgi:carboxypeptidase family protein/Big-like domain-containing protein